MMDSVTGRLGAAMMWSVVARSGRFVLGLASSVIVVRSLGDYDYGVLSLVRTFLMYVLIVAGAGLGQALLKFLPSLRVARNASAARTLVRNVAAANLLIWLLLTVLAWATRGAIENVFGLPGLGVAVTAAVALSLFEIFFTFVSQILNANYDTKLLSVASVASHIVYIVALLLVLPRGWGVVGVVAAGALGNAAACLVLIRRLRAAVEPAAAELPAETISLGRLARFSVPFAVIGVLNLIVWRQSETMFLAYFRTASETGFFDLAYRVPQTILEFVPGTVWPLVMAGFSEVYSRDRGSIRDAIDRYYRMLFLLCAPFCVTGMVLGGQMIPILFGEAMRPAAWPTQAFFGVLTISFFGTPLSMALYVMEKTHVNLIIYLCLAAVNVLLDLLLIPRFGVAGAVLPVGVVMLLSVFIYRIVVGRYVNDLRVPGRFIGKCFLASGGTLLLVPFLRFIDDLPSLLAAVVVAVIVTGLGFKLVRVLGKDEIAMLEAVPIPLAARVLKFIAS